MDNKNFNEGDNLDSKVIKIDASMVVPEVKEYSNEKVSNELRNAKSFDEQLFGVEVLNDVEEAVENVEVSDSFDVVLLKLFIGQNYKKICESKFSVSAFLFGGLYYLYRKMYIYGFWLLIFQLLIINLLKPIYLLIVMFVFSLLLGIFTNKIYFWYAKKRVANLMVIHSKSSSEVVKKVCSKKGGRNILVFIFGMITISIITFIWGKIALFYDFSSVFKNFSDIEEEVRVIKYEGFVNFSTKVKLADEVDWEIPVGFSEGIMNEDYLLVYEYGTRNEAVFNKCDIKLGVVEDYFSDEVLVEEMIKYYMLDGVENVDINQIEWQVFVVSDSFGKNYYYVTEKNNKVYLLKYGINIEAEVDVCENYRQEFLQSVRLK